MKYFCDNPECIAHVMVEDIHYSLRLPMSTPFNYKELRSHDYVTKNGKHFSLCTICSAAIDMIMSE
jgi:hypothetical protein